MELLNVNEVGACLTIVKLSELRWTGRKETTMGDVGRVSRDKAIEEQWRE